LIRLRNAHPAFGGEFSSDCPSESELVMRWRSGAERALLRVDFESRDYDLAISEAGTLRSFDITALAATMLDAGPRRAITGA
jgi:hypothetical protein